MTSNQYRQSTLTHGIWHGSVNVDWNNSNAVLYVRILCPFQSINANIRENDCVVQLLINALSQSRVQIATNTLDFPILLLLFVAVVVVVVTIVVLAL